MRAKSAAVPPARISQSSGCAPKAMILILPPSCAASVQQARKRIANRLNVTELAFPRGFAARIDCGAAQNCEQRTDGRALGHVFHVAGKDARQEPLDAVDGDVTLRFDGLDIVDAAGVDHALAGSRDRSLGAGEFLADTIESPRRKLVGLEVDVDALGEFKREPQVIQYFHGGAHFAAAITYGADGTRIQKPVQH